MKLGSGIEAPLLQADQDIRVSLLGDILQDVWSHVAVYPLDEHLGLATRLARDYGLRGADALQAATALGLRSRSGTEQYYFVAGDKRLLNVCRHEGLDTVDPEDASAIALLQAIRID